MLYPKDFFCISDKKSMSEQDETFIERYERLCKQAGLSQAKVSRATGINYQTFTDHRRRNTIFSAEECAKIAEVLNVSVDYLITGKSSELPPDIQDTVSMLMQLPENKRAPIIAMIKGQVIYFKNTI